MNKLKQIKIPLPQEYKITKLSDDVFNGKHPNFIDEGFTRTGIFTDPPTVGEKFFIQSPRSMEAWLRTSKVTEIIDEETFKTENSTYKLQKLYIEGIDEVSES